MVRKSRGFRHSTRKALAQKPRYRPTITKFLQQFSVGQKVVINPEPSSHKGMPFPRFKGLTATVIGKRGNSYILEALSGNKLKKIISRPEHLKKI